MFCIIDTIDTQIIDNKDQCAWQLINTINNNIEKNLKVFT